MGFLDRFRRPRDPVWFATLTGPLWSTRCTACGTDYAAREMAAPEYHECSQCGQSLPFFPLYVSRKTPGTINTGSGRLNAGQQGYLRNGERIPLGEASTPKGPDGREDYSRTTYANEPKADRDINGDPFRWSDGPWRCVWCLVFTDGWRSRFSEENLKIIDTEMRAAKQSYAKGRPDVAGRCPTCRGVCFYCNRAFPLPELGQASVAIARMDNNTAPVCGDCLDVLDQDKRVEKILEEGRKRRELERREPTIGTDEDGNAVTLAPDVRNRHVYIIGKTGSGKSSLLRNLIMQDMESGRGVIYLDPHGDTAHQLLGYVPSYRLNDVIYFCPADPDCPAFNLLATDYAPDKLARDMVSAIKMFFGDSWGPRLNQLLSAALLTLLLDRQHEPHSIADLQTILTDDDYRARVLDRCSVAPLVTFWRQTFPTMGKDAVNPVLNKLADLLMPTSPMERIFSSTRNALDLEAVMNDGKILLVNLSKGELGGAGAFLVGGLIVTAVAQAALARVKVPEDERVDCFLYVDEFQNFIIDSFESILSEARKYRLNLTLAHQYLNQVPSPLQAAIFGNVAAVVCLPISADDAGTMQREMSSPGKAPDLLDQVMNVLNTPAKQHPNWTAPQATEAWPSRHDFITLPPLSGFVKINTPENVHRFTIHHPSERPRDDTRNAILDRQRRDHESTTRPAAPPKPPESPPSEPPPLAASPAIANTPPDDAADLAIITEAHAYGRTAASCCINSPKFMATIDKAACVAFGDELNSLATNLTTLTARRPDLAADVAPLIEYLHTLRRYITEPDPNNEDPNFAAPLIAALDSYQPPHPSQQRKPEPSHPTFSAGSGKPSDAPPHASTDDFDEFLT